MENALCMPDQIFERSKVSVGCVPSGCHATPLDRVAVQRNEKFSTSLCTLEVFDGAIGIHGKGILTQRMPIYRDYKMKMKTEINKRLGLDSL